MLNVLEYLHVENFLSISHDLDSLATRLRFEEGIGVWYGEEYGGCNRVRWRVPRRLLALTTLDSRYMTLLHEGRMSDRANLTDASAGQLVTHKSGPPTTSMEVSQSTSV